MKVLIAGLLSIAALAAPTAEAVMIAPTGGILTALGSETDIDGLGSYEVHGVRNELVYVTPFGDRDFRDVAWGDAEVELTLDSLSLIGGARGSTDVLRLDAFTGSVSGMIGFDVLEPGRLWLDWDFLGDFLEAEASIVGEDGVLMRCVGSFGCGVTVGPGSPSELWLALDAGHYELSFSSHSEWGPGGIPVANTFALNLSPVPLPAAAWLLLSGLGGLSLLRRRRAS